MTDEFMVLIIAGLIFRVISSIIVIISLCILVVVCLAVISLV